VELAAAGFHVGIHEDEWRHEHTPEVFTPMDEVRWGDEAAGGGGATGATGDGEPFFGGGAFFKLSAAVGLDRWGEAPELLTGLFQTLVRVLREA